MPIIVSLSGVFAVPMFRSCRRLGLAVSLALFTSGLLAAEVDAAATTRAAAGTAAVSAASQATIGTRRARATRHRVSAARVSSSSIRRARLARARATQRAREYREASTPLFRTAADGSRHDRFGHTLGVATPDEIAHGGARRRDVVTNA